MLVLTLNNGSSSFKFQLYDWNMKRVVCAGAVERIGMHVDSLLEIKSSKGEEFQFSKKCEDHQIAITWALEKLSSGESRQIDDLSKIKVVGHRVVHGGDSFTESVLVTEEIKIAVEKNAPFAPLHNPINLVGIIAAEKVLPGVPQVVIPDTAWHHTMPASSYRYAVPSEWYEKFGVRRYGFHGTSYLYTSRRAAILLGKETNDCNLIIAHIGNGASMCAVKNGVSVDTSMGFTPLEGLTMGTRSGDIDPAILHYLETTAGYSLQHLTDQLNKESGVKGLSNGLIDRRDVQKAQKENNADAQLAFDVECYRMRKYIGAYIAALGHVDAIVLTAGVMEMSPDYREKMLDGLENLGIILDKEKGQASHTRNAETLISSEDSPIKIFVIPTDEELVMTEDAVALVNGTYRKHTEYKYYFESAEYRNIVREEGLKQDIVKEPLLEKIVVRG